jgi:hypothetical protein
MAVFHNYRISLYYPPEEEGNYYERMGITLRNTRGLISANEISKMLGLADVYTLERLIKKNVIEAEGTGRFKQAVTKFFKKSVIKKIEKYYGGQFLKNTKGLVSALEASKMDGMSAINSYFLQGLIKCVGVKASKSKIIRYFKKKDVEKLQIDRAKLKGNNHSNRGYSLSLLVKSGVITITDTKGLISEIEIEKIMGHKSTGSLPILIKKDVISDEGTGLYKNKVCLYFKKSVIKTIEKYYGGPF